MKLKPCPFCGKKVERPRSEGWGYYFYCQNCHSKWYPINTSKEEAIQAWNKRVMYFGSEGHDVDEFYK